MSSDTSQNHRVREFELKNYLDQAGSHVLGELIVLIVDWCRKTQPTVGGTIP